MILSRREWGLFLAIVVYSLIPTFGGLFRVLELAGGPSIVPENPRALADPVPIILHIVGSFLFCIAGALQFLPGIRHYRPAMHRGIGCVVAVAGCVSAASGLWMTVAFDFPAALQGTILFFVRINLGVLMLCLIIWAILASRSGNIFRHSASMVRAYAIGQGASTQALFGIGWMVIAGTEPAGSLRDGLMVGSWAVNMLIAEVVIGKLLRPKRFRAAGHSRA
ncbi:DUF2306 domain-containing protein [Roseobacter insulae]|nr:DUF2306 domain-containing protein [Roseobacter insulae]